MFVLLLRTTEDETTAVLVKKGPRSRGCINLWCRVCLWISELTNTDLSLLKVLAVMEFIARVYVCLSAYSGSCMHTSLCAVFTRISNLIIIFNRALSFILYGQTHAHTLANKPLSDGSRPSLAEHPRQPNNTVR